VLTFSGRLTSITDQIYIVSMKTLLTTADAARIMGVTPSHVRGLAAAGRIAGPRKVGRDTLFTSAGVDSFRRAAAYELSRRKSKRGTNREREDAR
jgi:excisionase family DNA binding protein